MPALIFDTSSDLYPLCLSNQHGIIETKVVSFAKNQSSDLIPTIEMFLHEHQLSIKELTFIGLGLGPGSLTGTRVGVMIAKSWGFALSIPLIGFCSLLWYLPPTLPDRLLIITDGKSNGLYILEVRNEQVGQPQCLDIKTLIHKVTLENWTLSGNAYIQNKIPELKDYFLAQVPHNFPWISTFCWRQYQKNMITSPKELTPIYLEKTSQKSQEKL